MSETSRTGRPDFIGKYRIDAVLGSGAMGVVYRGFDPMIEREVAIKTIRAELLSSEDGESWRQRFEREVRVAARCLHPNLVTVFDCGEEAGAPYIVMEYVAGRPLNEFQAATTFDNDTALYVTAQVLRALEMAHNAGITHRDIKPANIILLDNALVKVTDFGIARLESSSLTAHGSMVGTPSYMSPEQFMGGDVDNRSDPFSAGIMLYEMLCGERPFQGKSNAELLYRVANEAPPDPRSLNGRISPQLADVMLKALEKAPERRFQTARAFAEALAETETDPAAATVIALPSHAAAPMPPAREATPGGYDAEAVRRLEHELTKHIGPIAKVVLKKAAERARDEDELRSLLVESIGEGPAADAFRRSLSRTQLTSLASHARPSAASGGGPRLMLAPDEITATQKSLASLIGPVARVLVDRAALKARDHEEFFRTLAEAIPTEAERMQFLRKHLPGQ